MEVFSKSDIGLVRNQNQDDCRFGVISPSCVWAVVCDGMGGANGGNIASATAVEYISTKITDLYKEDMKTVRVVAAVIRSEDKIFATARGYGEFKGQWEFPGGKIEPGETPQEALVREIQEELDVKVEVGDLIDTIEYDYPSFHLSMDCFWCIVTDGEITLKEAEDARWLSKDELYSVDWLPADMELIEKLVLSNKSLEWRRFNG